MDASIRQGFARVRWLRTCAWAWLPLSLGALLLGIYGPLVSGTRIFVDYDLYTYFYPNHEYVAAALRSGRLPLWNPYLFAGVPALANVQTAIFYPLNWPGFFLPAPLAINLTIVTHILLAGLFTYGFVRRVVGTGRAGALLGAITFAFGGFISQQLGHPNQLSASAWLPLALLLFDRACRRRSWRAGALAALTIGVQALAGHPQETYFTLVAMAVYAVSLAWRNGDGLFAPVSARFPVALLPLPALFGIAALGGAIAAVQYIPTAELSARSIRSGGLAVGEASAFSLPPSEILRALLPTFGDPPLAEFIGYVGVVVLVLAVLAVLTRPGDRLVLTFALLTTGALLLAFGKANPLYPWLHEVVPGLNLFRAPTRWLFLVSFGLAVLGGIGLDLLRQGSTMPWRRYYALFATVILAWTSALVLGSLGLLYVPPMPVPLVWTGLGLAMLLAIGLTVARPRTAPSLGLLLLALAVAELMAAGRSLDTHHPTDPSVYADVPPGLARILQDRGEFRVLSLASSHYQVGDLPERRRQLGDLAEFEFTDYLVAHKYQAILTPNLPLRYRIATLDGYDGGVLPLKEYVEIKPLLMPADGGAPPAQLGQPDGLLRLQLQDLPDTRLLGLLNVKYLIFDRLSDGWVSPGPVYYDLVASRRAGPGQPIVVESLPEFPATTIGLATALVGAPNVPDGTPVARVTIVDAEGRSTTTELRAGIETAEQQYEGPSRPAHRQPPALAARRGLPGSFVYESRMHLPAPGLIRRVRVDYLGAAGTLDLRGLTLIGAQVQDNVPVTLAERLRLVELGDLKIYENLDLLPRAFVAYRATSVDTTGELIDAIRSDPGQIVLQQEPPEGRWSDRPPDPAEILVGEPERVVVRARLPEPGWLVLSEANYPGWSASTNGRSLTIERANHLFRAVALPAGEHTVEFRFEPRSLRTGAEITLLGLLILAGLMVWPARRR